MPDTIKNIVATHSGGPEMVSEIKYVIQQFSANKQLSEPVQRVLDRFYIQLRLYSLKLHVSNGADLLARKLLEIEWQSAWTILKTEVSVKIENDNVPDETAYPHGLHLIK
jgi:hypothetical protein